MSAPGNDGPLELTLDGTPVPLDPPARCENGIVWVPLEAFCAAAGAVPKEVDGRLAVCDEGRGHVCVMLEAADVTTVDGTCCGRLEAFADALGLTCSVSAQGVLCVTRGAGAMAGLAVGRPAPPIELPDVDSGQPVSWEAFRKRPAVFYMWASW